MRQLHPHVLWAMAGIAGILVLATAAVWLAGRLKPDRDLQEMRQRIRSWWIMAAFFLGALTLTRKVSLTFFAFVSFLALKEYLSLIPTRRADRSVQFLAYVSIPLQYYFIGMEWYGMFLIWIPVYMLLLMPMRLVLVGETSGFLRSAGTLHWGLMMTVFSISHVAYLLVLPGSVNPNGGGAALVLYLVFLTQANDVAQFLWGKSVGRRPVVPSVSPNKTWGGLLGGVGTTVVLGVVLARWLTPMAMREAILATLIIGLGGFVGDVVISAVKRDLDIKDSGTMLPGHGGILDRIDSLTYTAPLFFHFTYYLYV